MRRTPGAAGEAALVWARRWLAGPPSCSYAGPLSRSCSTPSHRLEMSTNRRRPSKTTVLMYQPSLLLNKKNSLPFGAVRTEIHRY